MDERIAGYRFVKEDFARGKSAMITKLKADPLDESKLKMIQSLQKQIDTLLACTNFLDDYQTGNVVTVQAFRLLVGDMIVFFHVLNEAVLRLLAVYFELEKPLAKLALEIYKDFADQTKKTTAFFDAANRMTMELGLKIPQFKHVIFQIHFYIFIYMYNRPLLLLLDHYQIILKLPTLKNNV